MLARISSCRSNPADVGPHLERTRPCGTVLAGGDMAAVEMGEVVDLIVGGEETLCLARRLEALHLALSSGHRQVDVSGLAELASRGRCWRGFQAAAATPLMSAHISNPCALAARYSLAVTWSRWGWERLLI